jgi:hypothetical protein
MMVGGILIVDPRKQIVGCWRTTNNTRLILLRMEYLNMNLKYGHGLPAFRGVLGRCRRTRKAVDAARHREKFHPRRYNIYAGRR